MRGAFRVAGEAQWLVKRERLDTPRTNISNFLARGVGRIFAVVHLAMLDGRPVSQSVISRSLPAFRSTAPRLPSVTQEFVL